MSDDERVARLDRRRFMSRLAATMAAGVGLAATGRIGARPAGARAQSCAIYCQPADGCAWCGPGHRLYDCYSACDGWSRQCLPNESCTGHCASQYAC